MSRFGSWMLIAIAWGGAALVVVGCNDRSSESNAIVLEKPATQPTRPTTQELVSGTYTRIGLKIMPFSVEVPRGWQIKSVGGVQILEGPSPSGVIQIQLGKHGSPIAQHAERLIEGAKKDAAANPGPFTLANVREINSFKLLETRSAGKTSPIKAIDSAGNVIAETSTNLRWKISVFVPNGRDTDVCELNFRDLTAEQYDIDKPLVDRVIASLQYDAKAEGN